MSSSYTSKTAARRLSELTGHPYQRCLNALRTNALHDLVPNPNAAHPRDIAAAAAAALTLDGVYGTHTDAATAVLTATVAAVVRHHHPDAATATVEMDEEAPHVGFLGCVSFADGEELDGVWGEPVADDALPWAALLADALELAPGECHTVPLT